MTTASEKPQGLRPQRVAKVLMLATVLGVCYQNYWLYSNIDRYFSGYWLSFIRGNGAAPEQYRIAVKTIAWWLVHHFSWGFRHGYTLLDVIAGVPAVLLLCNLLDHRLRPHTAELSLRWFASAGFIALFCFYMLWEGFFFRPETMPTLALTVCLAVLWTSRGRGRSMATISGLLATSLAEAWVRADVPFALNTGIFLACLSGSGCGLSLSRRAAMATSGTCVALAAGTQLYISRVLYPQATYGNIPKIMITHDLHHPLKFVPFLIFLLPVVWTTVQAWEQRASLDTLDQGLLFGAAVYFVLWIVMGKLDEVRIFLPFAVILIPLTVQLAIASFRESASSLYAAAETEA